MSVRPSVHLSNAWIVTKRKKHLWPHSYTTRKNIRSSFLTKRMVGGSDPFYLKFCAKLTLLPVGAKTPKRYEIECQLLVLITNRMSHTGCQLVSTSVTLNNLEPHNSRRYFTEFDSFAGQLRHVIEDRTMTSAKYRLPVTFGQN